MKKLERYTSSDVECVCLDSDAAQLEAAHAELLAAAKLILTNWPVQRDGMDGELLPVGVKAFRTAIAKAQGEVMP